MTIRRPRRIFVPALIVLGVAVALIATQPASASGLKVVKVAKNVPTVFFEGDRLDPSLHYEFYGAWSNALHKRRILGQSNDPQTSKPGWTPACCGRIFYEYGPRLWSIKVDGSGRRRHGRVPNFSVSHLEASEGGLNQRLGLYAYLLDDASGVGLLDIRSRFKKTIYAVQGPSGPPGLDTPPPLTLSSPVISPGGQRIAFLLDRSCPPPNFDCLPLQLWVVNKDGSGAHVVLDDAEGVDHYRFSRDASKILFNDDEFNGVEVENSDLFAVNVGGGQPIRLTNTPGTSEGVAIYSPDAQQIAYHDLLSSSIFVINSSGGGKLRLTIARKQPRFGFDIPSFFANITWEKRRRR